MLRLYTFSGEFTIPLRVNVSTTEPLLWEPSNSRKSMLIKTLLKFKITRF